MHRTGFKAASMAGALMMALSFTQPIHAMSFSGDTPKVEDVQTIVDMGKFDMAIEEIKKVIEKDPENADAWNLLGFSYRKSGQLDLSWDAYERALTLNPDHIGATEYLGELYIAQGNLDQAKAQLDKLTILCPSGCEALDTLDAAIKAAQ